MHEITACYRCECDFLTDDMTDIDGGLYCETCARTVQAEIDILKRREDEYNR